MKRPGCKITGISVLAAVLCFALLAGCVGQQLSGDFNEEEVRKAAGNVITLINDQDSDALRDLCTVRMREALADDVLKQVYEAISEGGQFEKVEAMSVAGTTDASSGEEFAVVVARAKYEIKTFTFTISFTKQMKLAGLYYR
jgi:outer membrane murein-binding lipoprotein Lpp